MQGDAHADPGERGLFGHADTHQMCGGGLVERQGQQLVDAPDVVGEPGLHRGSASQGLVDPAEVVVNEVQRHCRLQVPQLLAEGVGQPREATHGHARVQVAPLHVVCRHPGPLGVARDHAPLHALDPVRGRVAVLPLLLLLGVNYDLDWSRAEKTGAVFFRPGDALAQSLVEKALDRPTPQATLVFSFQPQQAALAPLIGQSGWLVARRLHVEALERTEEHLLVAACSDQGTPIAPDIASKLFSLEATVSMDSEAPIPAPLLQVAAELQKAQVQDVRQRNEQFFEEETTKVEEQTEDLKLGLEREVKKLDKEITAARKVVHKATTLADKIKAKQAVATLETKRNQKLQLLFQEQDRLSKEMSKLIEGMKQNLDNLAIKVEDVFAVRWTLVSDSTTQDLPTPT